MKRYLITNEEKAKKIEIKPKGLEYYHNYIFLNDVNDLMKAIKNPILRWRNEINGRSITLQMDKETVMGFPHVFDGLFERLKIIIPLDEFNQIVVHEYGRKNSQPRHIDDSKGDMIVIVTLYEPVFMLFLRETENEKKIYHLTMYPNSVLVLKGEAKKSWKFECLKIKQFEDKNAIYKPTSTYKRLSFTFRKI